MSERKQRIWAPILILIAIVALWETLVTAFNIQQFLLPKPSAIIGNLVQIAVIDADRFGIEHGRHLAEKPVFGCPAGRTVAGATGDCGAGKLAGDSAGQAQRFVPPRRQPDADPGGKLVHAERGAGRAGNGHGCGHRCGARHHTRWTASREALLPFAIAANSMPIIAFAPIMNNWFGIDNPFSKMAIVTIMIFFPIMINTVRGLISVNSRSLELMRSYAASESEILIKLRIPNALPSLFSGLKVAGALAMIGAIVGEYFGGPRIALGVFITQEAALFRFGYRLGCDSRRLSSWHRTLSHHSTARTAGHAMASQLSRLTQ